MMIDLPSYGPTNRIRLGSFLRVRPLVLNYEGSEKLTDFQVKCVFTPSDIPFEKLRADKQDLLFVNNNNEPIPYWIEKADGTEIVVWLKFPQIISGKEVFWLYYGNGNFSGVSDPDATFIRIIDSVVGSWHFDEGSGTTAYDSSGNDNDGTINGATWIDGKFGKALSFDGIDDYVRVSDDESLELTGDVSIAVWIKPVIDSDYHGIVSRGASYEYELAADFREGTYDLAWRHTNTARNFPNFFTDGEIWYFVTAVRDSNELRMYKNGEYFDSATFSGSPEPSTNPLDIGKRSLSGYRFEGVIDEVFLFNRALTEQEISDLYNNYGYTTENYPGKVLVRKYSDMEPIILK